MKIDRSKMIQKKCVHEKSEEHDRNVKIAEIRLGIRVNSLESHGANLSIVLDAEMPQQKSGKPRRFAVNEQIAFLES
jgi:hypothetical protein